VSSNGQVSIPAEVRRRWRVNRVLVIDKGGQVIIRPIPADPRAEVIGKYARALPPSEQVRRLARAEEGEREARR
jgi:AbrB family looped-hinge helix DNA binding protein